jgi:large subunit ribosomal protein L5
MNRYKKLYKEIISQDYVLKNNSSTIFELPKIERIIINSTSKKYIQDRKQILPTLLALEVILGQKSKLTYAKKSLASFKIRKGQIVGAKITLRGHKIYTLLDRLSTLIFPKFRDFSGFSKKSMNTFNHLSFGFDNLIVFPELENHFEFFEIVRGLTISIILENKKNNYTIYSAFQIPEKVM